MKTYKYLIKTLDGTTTTVSCNGLKNSSLPNFIDRIKNDQGFYGEGGDFWVPITAISSVHDITEL